MPLSPTPYISRSASTWRRKERYLGGETADLCINGSVLSVHDRWMLQAPQLQSDNTVRYI